MADCGCLQSPTSRYIKPISISSIFFNNCPKLFTGMTPDSQLLMSPTSILDSIPFSGFKNPFSSESITPKSNPEPDHHNTNRRLLWSNLDSNSNKVGLSNILESLEQDTKCSKHSKPETRMVLFGSQLKIQIPIQPSYTKDFGIKTRTCRVNAPQNAPKEEVIKNVKSNGVFSDCFSPIDMETSEDYTCVITHGPNPKTTHIYNNCIVHSSCGIARSLADTERSQTDQHHRLPDDFLSKCCTCGKYLNVGEDIYMYKGEKAFCSDECRYEEMRLHEDNSDFDY